MLRVDVEAAPELNHAMVHNAVPLIQRIAVTNPTETTIRDLQVSVELQPGISQTWSRHVEALPGGATYHIDEVDLPLDRARLVNATERERATLAVEVRADGAVRGRRSRDGDLLAYNEWSAVSVPQLLAAFVLPNHPAVGETLTRARQLLEERTGDPTFNGYQSSSPQRIRSQIAAIYAAIQSLDITYVSPPASFESTGQKIRTPEQILTNKMGTCLDLSVLFAACIEQVGLYPLVFLVDGHAFPGAWLVDQNLPEAASDDGLRFCKFVELEAMTAFDSTTATLRPAVDFAQAQQLGTRHHRTARESLQETGTNTLCVALGFLYRYESDSSDLERLAPLILIPAAPDRTLRNFPKGRSRNDLRKLAGERAERQLSRTSRRQCRDCRWSRIDRAPEQSGTALRYHLCNDLLHQDRARCSWPSGTRSFHQRGRADD